MHISSNRVKTAKSHVYFKNLNDKQNPSARVAIKRVFYFVCLRIGMTWKYLINYSAIKAFSARGHAGTRPDARADNLRFIERTPFC